MEVGTFGPGATLARVRTFEVTAGAEPAPLTREKPVKLMNREPPAAKDVVPSAVPPPAPASDAVVVRRRTIDTVLIAAGVVVTVVLLAAGALLTWGSNFAEDYVDDQLSSQAIFFPDTGSLEEEGRDDLMGYADEQVTTGARPRPTPASSTGTSKGRHGATHAELEDRSAKHAKRSTRRCRRRR